MNAIENMITRRSVRAYKSDMVPKQSPLPLHREKKTMYILLSSFC